VGPDAEIKTAEQGHADLFKVREAEHVRAANRRGTVASSALARRKLGRDHGRIWASSSPISAPSSARSSSIFLGACVHPKRFRIGAVVRQMFEVWVKALLIVGVLCFLIGVVIAYQGVQQLRQFGAETFTVEAVGIGMFRELGVLLTAIIVAGRSGSAFTARSAPCRSTRRSTPCGRSG
jgi:phospholipid/cholesterol/gamma-HCH transport system permease protein